MKKIREIKVNNNSISRNILFFIKKCDKFMKGLMAHGNIIYILCLLFLFCLLLAAFLLGWWFGGLGFDYLFFCFFFFLNIFQRSSLFGLRFGFFGLGFNFLSFFILHIFQGSSFFRYGHYLLFKVIFIKLVTIVCCFSNKSSFSFRS